MGRILAIDYGTKRTGMAVTDPLQLSINPLPTIETSILPTILAELIEKEGIEIILLGHPHHHDGRPTQIAIATSKLKTILNSSFPEIKVELVDEAFSSADAKELLVMTGVKKKKRKQKGILDQASAVLILKQYLNTIS